MMLLSLCLLQNGPETHGVWFIRGRHLLCETLPFMVDIDEVYKVCQGKQDQAQAENQLCDVQQCPRNSKVPSRES